MQCRFLAIPHSASPSTIMNHQSTSAIIRTTPSHRRRKQRWHDARRTLSLTPRAGLPIVLHSQLAIPGGRLEPRGRAKLYGAHVTRVRKGAQRDGRTLELARNPPNRLSWEQLIAVGSEHCDAGHAEGRERA